MSLFLGEMYQVFGVKNHDSPKWSSDNNYFSGSSNGTIHIYTESKRDRKR